MQNNELEIDKSLLGRMCSNATSLSAKFLVLIIVILAITMSAATFLDVYNERQELIQQMEENGMRLGEFISLVSPEAVLSYDMISLGNYMKRIGEQKDITYAMIQGPDNKLLAYHLDTNDPMLVEKYGLTKDALSPQTVNHRLLEQLSQENNIISLVFPVIYDSELIATLHIGMSTNRIHALANTALYRDILINFIIIAFLGLCIFAVFRFKIINPLHELMRSSAKVAEGNLDEKTRVNSNDELGCLARSFNDMTDALKHSYREKDEALEVLQETNFVLEQTTRSKSEFLANMSHEIRTPLTAIIGFGEMLMDPAITTEEEQSAKQTIIRSSKHLLSIINDILDLSKIEANKLNVTPVKTSPFEIISEVESLIGMHAREKGLACHVNYLYPLPAHINTDPMRLKQVLINLCGNAVKFTDRGSIHLNVSHNRLKNTMSFEVVDTGIGMSEAQKASMFDAFIQGDTSSVKRFAGTGLGLHLSRRLVTMLGGDIHVESELGVGSRFRFFVATGPVDESDYVYEKQQDRLSMIIPIKSRVQHQSARILVAEDNPDNQSLISFYIRQFGAEPVIAPNGLEAIEKALAGRFDLVLMDIQMPVMDGLQATGILRSRGYKQPIIALTANAFNEDRERCLCVGCDDFLPKPIDREKFEQLLHKHLSTDAIASQPQVTANKAPTKTENTTTTDDEDKLIYSSLLQQEPELSYIVKSYIGRLADYEDRIDKARQTQDWQILRQVFHDLRGTGSSMGYPMLTDIATEASDHVKQENLEKLDNTIHTLHGYCSRIRSGFSKVHTTQAS